MGCYFICRSFKHSCSELGGCSTEQRWGRHEEALVHLGEGAGSRGIVAL